MNLITRTICMSLVGISFAGQNAAQASEFTVSEDLNISTLTEAQTAASWGDQVSGQVNDASGNPVKNVEVVCNGKVLKTNADGRFLILTVSGSEPIVVKKAGYRKVSLAPQAGVLNVTLKRAEVRSLYLQPGYLKSGNAIFTNEMNLASQTELNAVTVDFKTDDGAIVQGLKPYIEMLHAKHVYAIARVVAFKDTRTVNQHPDWAITGLDGKPWRNKKGLTFLNPFNKDAQAYLISVAEAAVAAGFDEVQYDYVRFPDQSNVATTALWKDTNGNAFPYNAETRTGAIQKLLATTKLALDAKGAFLAADVFGDTAFTQTDSGLGQRIEDIAPYLDYVCPMIYPSGYGTDYDGISHPEKHPAAIVGDSMRRYRKRADKTNPDLVIRAWLQAFQGYVEHTPYGAAEISAQIDACKKNGGPSDGGFLLWNAANHYSNAGLSTKDAEDSVL